MNVGFDSPPLAFGAELLGGSMFLMEPHQAALLYSFLICAGLLSARSSEDAKPAKQSFGATSDGHPVELFTLSNDHGMQVAVSNFGATLVSLKVPDRAGKIDDIVLGYDSVSGYESGKSFFGATIGRYGNRIAHGKFTLDGVTYSLPKNNGDNTLHGGTIGFNKHIWTARELDASDGQAVEFTYTSRDGEEGFPGTLSVKVVYTLLRGKNELRIDYGATTDKNTVINLTNHSYFNLSGQGSGDILHDVLTLEASKFATVDASLIPTGELRDVTGTPFDFRKPTSVGARIDQDDEQLKVGKGYDHNWVIDRTPGSSENLLAAKVEDPASGRVLEVLTSEPGVQFYSGNHLERTSGKLGKSYDFRGALCLETQHFPDSPNHPNFPSTELKPGERYGSTTIFRFSAR
jgi:aldose 1-epimerase